MSGIWLALIGFLVFFLGYRFYSKYIAEKVYRLDPNYKTPAHQFNDGVDFVPTNKFVLWGHHFTSVAGAAPIVGPAIAVYWGWLPALLWVVLGTVFAAGVHDSGTLFLSVRNKGQSVGTIANKLIGQRAKILFLFIILLLVLMVNAVFAWVIANLFVSYPSSVLSVFIQIPLAIWIGVKVYKKSGSMLLPSIAALIVMYGTAVLASQYEFLQIDLVKYMGGEGSAFLGMNTVSVAFFVWIIILMVYVYIASTLPVWKLLQPRDYINSHQLILGLLIFYLGLFITQPEVTAPVTNSAANDVSWFPLLFITVACGAISGFHGLVSSGTSSKQLDNERDVRFVGYLGAIGEGLLALISIIAVVTFFGSTDEFLSTYSSFTASKAGGLNVFVEGAAQLAQGLGIPLVVAQTIVAVIIVSFAATTLDSSVRLMRYIISELGQEYKIPSITGKHAATSIAVIASAVLALIPEDPTRGFGSGGYLLWPLFGTTNQLLAGISLLLLAIYLGRKGRNMLPALIPMAFLMIMTLYAMFVQVFLQWAPWGSSSSWLLFVFGAVVFIFAGWIVLTAISVINNERKNNQLEDAS